MRGIRGVVFDCDGVLFESRRANLAFYGLILKHFGEEPVDPTDRELAHHCHTAASPEVLATLLGKERAAAALDYACTLDPRQFFRYMTPEPDLVWTLELLSERLPLGIATNRGASMPEILEHFGLAAYFSTVITSRDVQRPKPHPDMLLLAAARLGAAPEELVFVGDSELDRQAARSAGMNFVAYRWEGEGDVRIEGHRDLVPLLCGTETGGRVAARGR